MRTSVTLLERRFVSFNFCFFNFVSGCEILIPSTLPPPDQNGNFIREEFEKAKSDGKFPMDQMPMLEVITPDGNKTSLCQSKSVLRYVANRAGLMGRNLEETADIDSVGEAIVELLGKFKCCPCQSNERFLRSDLARFINIIERVAGNDGYCVGGRLSMADILLYHLAVIYFEPQAFFGISGYPEAAAALLASPKISKIVATVGSNPGIIAWNANRLRRGDVF